MSNALAALRERGQALWTPYWLGLRFSPNMNNLNTGYLHLVPTIKTHERPLSRPAAAPLLEPSLLSCLSLMVSISHSQSLLFIILLGHETRNQEASGSGNFRDYAHLAP